jgi:hypothetical protein
MQMEALSRIVRTFFPEEKPQFVSGTALDVSHSLIK